MWNMKKYRIVVGVWMLLLSSASCMDDTGRYGQDNRNYRITASIEDANVASRVADKITGLHSRKMTRFLSGGAEAPLISTSVRERTTYLFRTLRMPTGNYGRDY